jgi:hypothetical protein
LPYFFSRIFFIAESCGVILPGAFFVVLGGAGRRVLFSAGVRAGGVPKGAGLAPPGYTRLGAGAKGTGVPERLTAGFLIAGFFICAIIFYQFS